MASSRLPPQTPPLSVDLECAICLEVFTDPVTISCGHNFCKACIARTWDDTAVCKCPVCMKTFVLRPELCVNTAFRDIASAFKSGSSPHVPVEVLSDDPECLSSLDSGASSCKKDLGRDTPLGVQEDGDTMDRPISFCSSDWTSESVSCSEGPTAPVDSERTEKMVTGEDHATSSTEASYQNVQSQKEEDGHAVTSTEASHVSKHDIQSQKEKAEVATTSAESGNVQHDIQSQKEKAEVATTSAESGNHDIQSQKEKAEVATTSAESGNVQHDIPSQKEKAEVATTSAESGNVHHNVQSQREEAPSSAEARRLSQDIQRQQEEAEVVIAPPAERHNHSYQGLMLALVVVLVGCVVPSVLHREPPHSLHQTQSRPTQEDMQQKIKGCMLKLAKDTTDLNKIPPERRKAIQSECELWAMQLYKGCVTLDAETANPFLALSEDGKQVRHANTRRYVPDNPKRFLDVFGVLGKEGLSSGRLYYEVQVKNKIKWSLGVVARSVDRVGVGLVIASPENGQWTLSMRHGNEYGADTDPRIPISLHRKPQKVGVFVDHEAGQVSFYDVDDKSHIYSFTRQTFTEELYPFFNPGIDWDGMNSAPLVITPFSQNSNSAPTSNEETD